jgi:hypothetical protein
MDVGLKHELSSLHFPLNSNPYNREMHVQKPAASAQRIVFILPWLLLPALFFYAILFAWNVDLPCGDDYDILGFVLHLRSLPGIGARLLAVLTDQHNEYKIMLGHALFALQYKLVGHVSFSILNVIGDMGIFWLALVLWRMFLPAQPNNALRLALFVPVCWLLFQLSYAETLNAAEPAIQNLYILVFSFLAFDLLTRPDRRSFLCSLLCLVLAITASGNGFITGFIGTLYLGRNGHRLGRLSAWIGAITGMAALYAYHYNVMASQGDKHGSIFAAMLDLKVLYIVSFLGSIGELAHFAPHISVFSGSLILGFTLCLLYLYLMVRGKLSTNAAVNSAVLFIFLTGVGVAGLRSGLGVEQSLSSRYRIYSSLLLILTWFLISERHLQHLQGRLARNWFYLGGCFSAVVISLLLDVQGYHFIVVRKDATVQGMRLYENPTNATDQSGPMVVDRKSGISFTPEVNLAARELLGRSIAAGIYNPPHYEPVNHQQ